MKEGNDECHGLDSKTRNLRSKATSISGLFKLESTQRLRSLGPQFVNQPLEARDPALLYPFGAHRPTDTDNQIFSSVQFSRSVVSNSLRPHESQHARPPCPSPIPEFTQTQVHWVGDAIQPSHPLSSFLLLPSIFPSIRVFSNESALRIRWPKYWSFSFNISPSNEHPGLISFRMDSLDLLAVQGTLKSLQHHSSKASILRCSAFFIV